MKHLGIVAGSAEGTALYCRTICQTGAEACSALPALDGTRLLACVALTAAQAATGPRCPS